MGGETGDARTVLRRLVQRLESLQRSGVTHISRVPVVTLEATLPVAPAASGTARPSGVEPTEGERAGSSARSSSTRRTPSDIHSAALPAAASVDVATTPQRAETRSRESAGKSAHPPSPIVGPRSPPAPAPDRPSPPIQVVGLRDLQLTPPKRVAALDELRGEVCQCRLCPMLVANRSRTVFGVGPVTPRLVFFGEAPGEDEDRTGEPFVGAAGQQLNRMIKAMTLAREEVYIMNVLKCRPPGNRTPNPDEVENCRPFFTRQLDILQPEFICCLGGSAAQALLQTRMSIGQMRGKFYQYGKARVMPTYHPSYLLRTPSAKRQVWDDLQKLMAEMGLKLPG